MITKKGYVFVAISINGASPIFGKPKDKASLRVGYENIISNELTPFDVEENMRRVLNKFENEERPEVKKVIPASLDMQIAESEEELDFFRGLTDLVAIRTIKEKNYTEMKIYGPINPNFRDLHHGVIPAHRIDQNGLLPFRTTEYGTRTFEVAMEARYQIQRQSDNAPTAIGTFKLKKLPSQK
jgi:hypothetical protein